MERPIDRDFIYCACCGRRGLDSAYTLTCDCPSFTERCEGCLRCKKHCRCATARQWAEENGHPMPYIVHSPAF